MPTYAITLAGEAFTASLCEFQLREGACPPLAGSAAEKKWISDQDKRIAGETKKLEAATSGPPLDLNVFKGDKAVEVAEKARCPADTRLDHIIKPYEEAITTAKKLIAAARVVQAQAEIEEHVTSKAPLEMELEMADAIVEAGVKSLVPAEEIAAAKRLVAAATAAQAWAPLEAAIDKELMDIDTKAVDTLVPPAEAAGVDAEKMEKAMNTIAAAKIAQASAKLQALIALPLLEVDVPAAVAAADAAEAVFVPAAEVEAARGTAAAAKDGQAKRDAAAAALSAAIDATALAMDVPTAEAAVEAAAEAGVASETVEVGRALAAAAKDAQGKRDAAAAALAAAIAPVPLDINVPKAEACVEEAEATGVPAETVEEAKGIVKAAKLSQAEVRLAAAIAPAPLDMDLTEADEAVVVAEAVGLAAEKIEMAKGIVKTARVMQAEAMLNAVVDAGPVGLDVPAVKMALEVAKEAGVNAELIAKATLIWAQANLTATITPPPLEVDVPAAEAAMASAAEVGLTEDVENAKPPVAAAKKAQASEKLQALVAPPLLEVDVAAAVAAADVAEVVFVSPDEVEAARTVVATAKMVQASRDAAAAALATAISGEPLKVDVVEAKMLTEAAAEAGVAAETVAKATSVVAAAKEAQGSARLAAAIAHSPLDMDTHGADAAVEYAIEALVATDTVEDAKRLIATAKIEQASTKLTAAIEAADLEMDWAAAVAAADAAEAVFVPAEEVKGARDLASAARAAQEQRDGATAALAVAIAPPALEMDVPKAEAAVEYAVESRVVTETVEEARKLAAVAKEAQGKRAAAAAALAVAIAPAWLEMDVPKAEACIEAAVEAYVAEEEVNQARTLSAAAKDAQEKRDAAGAALDAVTADPMKSLEAKDSAFNWLQKAQMAAEAAEAAAADAADAKEKKAEVEEEGGFWGAIKKSVTANPISAAAASLFGTVKLAQADDVGKSAEAARKEAVEKAGPMLNMDVLNAQELLATATETGVSADKIQQAQALLTAATEAQAKRDVAAAILAAAISPAPLLVDVLAADAAVAAATEAGVEKERVDAARGLAAAAKAAQDRRDAADIALAAAIAFAPLEVDVPKAEACVEEAEAAGVSTRTVDTSSGVVKEAKLAQAEVTLTAAMVAAPLELDVSSAETALEVAKALGSKSGIVGKAQSMVKAAKQLQAKREEAADLLLKLSTVKVRKMDVPAAEKALTAAVAANVQSDRVEKARALIARGKEMAEFDAAQKKKLAAQGIVVNKDKDGVNSVLNQFASVSEEKQRTPTKVKPTRKSLGSSGIASKMNEFAAAAEKNIASPASPPKRTSMPNRPTPNKKWANVEGQWKQVPIDAPPSLSVHASF